MCANITSTYHITSVHGLYKQLVTLLIQSVCSPFVSVLITRHAGQRFLLRLKSYLCFENAIIGDMFFLKR